MPMRRALDDPIVFAITRFVVAALALTLLGKSADAQATGGGGGHRQRQQKAAKTDVQKPKADDKAYNAALKSLPDKPFDPWRGAR
jgi:hypothetical protein